MSKKTIADAPQYRGASARGCSSCKYYKWIDGAPKGVCEKYEFETSDDYVCDIWEEREHEPMMVEIMDAEKSVIAFGDFGDAIKAIELGDGNVRVEGYLIRFGTPNETDLVCDFFTAKTDFGFANKSHTWFNHTLPTEFIDAHGVKRAARVTKQFAPAELSPDDVGVFLRGVLNERDEFEKMLIELARQKKLGLSSGVPSHLVERKTHDNGAHEITRWILGGDASYTHTPAEPRNQVVALKSLIIGNVELDKPGAQAEGGQTTVAGAVKTETTLTITQVPKKQEVKMADEQKPVGAQPEKPADNTAELKSAVDALKTEIDAMKSAPATNLGAPATIGKVSERGFKNDEMKSFLYWIRTGDPVAYKAAMQGQTDSEGGYAVPDDFYNQVVAKRNEVSVMRQAGVQVMQTSLDRLLVPVEDTAATKFVVTAEEGSYSENEPTLAQVAITVHKLTKLIKISEELESDAKANFGAYLAGVWGRTLGLAENYYFCNVAANGSSQPQSITYASTATTAVASQTVVTAAELLAVIYAVPSAYSNNLVILMRRSTLGAIRALTGNPFAFIPTPTGAGGVDTSSGSAGTLHNVPVFLTDDLPAQAAANKPIVVFNPDFYMIVEREGLTVSRNPYLYQATGQIGLFARARLGGAALQAEAAYHLLSKT